MLRSIQKSKGQSLAILVKSIQLSLEKVKDHEFFKEETKRIGKLVQGIIQFIKSDPESIKTASRELSFSLYRLFTGNETVFVISFNKMSLKYFYSKKSQLNNRKMRSDEFQGNRFTFITDTLTCELELPLVVPLLDWHLI